MFLTVAIVIEIPFNFTFYMKEYLTIDHIMFIAWEGLETFHPSISNWLDLDNNTYYPLHLELLEILPDLNL